MSDERTPTLGDLWATSHVAFAPSFEWPEWWLAFVAVVDGLTVDVVREAYRLLPKPSQEIKSVDVFGDL